MSESPGTPPSPTICLGRGSALILPAPGQQAAALTADPGTPLLLLGPGLPEDGLRVTLRECCGDVLIAALRDPLEAARAGSRIAVRLGALSAALQFPR